MQRRMIAYLTTLAMVLVACSSSDDGAPATTGDAASTTAAEPDAIDPGTTEASAAPSTLATEIELDGDIRPGVEQITLIGATPGTEIEVIGDADGTTAASGTVDDYGSLVFRSLDADTDYRLATDDGVTTPVDVLSRTEHPDASFFSEQRLTIGDDNSGFDYIETRDGTTLGAYILLPGPLEDGPYPTVVEYSGYSPSNPEQGVGFATLFSSLGYAYVGVNIRGTGCSGGSFRFFEYTQSTDGYDVVEAVAAQPWVETNSVGMVGISYPGISQLFVAQTQPPSLKAITPLSVLDDSYQSTLYPGGILNTGFAVNWTRERVDESMPSIDAEGNSTETGQAWTRDQIATGDDECAANQSVRLQNPDLVGEIEANEFYDAAVGDDISPRLFVDQIQVPTFLAGAWQDEQTGGRFPTMIDRFTGTDHLYVTMLNGLHTESISPAVLPRMLEFLDLYVAERTPDLGPARAIAPVLAGGLWGTDEVGDIPDRFTGMDYADALAAFEAEMPIQVMFEQGAAEGAGPLTPLPRFVESFESWPIPSTEARTWYLGPDGQLSDSAVVSDQPSASYLAVPDGGPKTFWSGNSSDLWRTDVVWDWQEPAPGTFASFNSSPLEETLTMAGSGSADLWINANLDDTDLEVTLIEVRPDGNEVMVQSGWLRASHRRLDDDASSDLRPVHTHLESDASPLPLSGDDPLTSEYALARVEIFPFAHVFRAGSQIRILIDAPGGNRAVWDFESIVNGEQVNIAIGDVGPSAIVLPVIPGIEVPEAYPDCFSLRGQPCRATT